MCACVRVCVCVCVYVYMYCRQSLAQETVHVYEQVLAGLPPLSLSLSFSSTPRRPPPAFASTLSSLFSHVHVIAVAHKNIHVRMLRFLLSH